MLLETPLCQIECALEAWLSIAYQRLVVKCINSQCVDMSIVSSHRTIELELWYFVPLAQAIAKRLHLGVIKLLLSIFEQLIHLGVIKLLLSHPSE